MILIISNSKDDTVKFLLSKKLFKRKILLINSDTFFHKYTINYSNNKKDIIINNTLINIKKIRSIWYRKPEEIKVKINYNIDKYEKKFLQREIEKIWQYFLFLLKDCYWINHPINNYLANNKLEQLQRAQLFGMNIPNTIISNNPDSVSEFIDSNVECIIKPISYGFIERNGPKADSLIYTNILKKDNDLIKRIKYFPILLQNNIKKKYDIRVNYINKKLFSFRIHSQEKAENKIDFRRNNCFGIKYSSIVLPSKLIKNLINLLKSYNLNFAAIDLIEDINSNYFFIELNPNGQWAWIEQLTNTEMSKELVKDLEKFHEKC